MRIDEAARCETCGVVGEVIISQRIESPSTREPMDVAVYCCVNSLCLNLNFRWVVQSNMQGEVIERERGTRGHDKEFPNRSSEALSRGKRYLEEILSEEIVDN